MMMMISRTLCIIFIAFLDFTDGMEDVRFDEVTKNIDIIEKSSLSNIFLKASALASSDNKTTRWRNNTLHGITSRKKYFLYDLKCGIIIYGGEVRRVKRERHAAYIFLLEKFQGRSIMHSAERSAS